jgi:hypothetical protein
MATEQYMSPLYAAFLSAYDINDDTAPTTDPDMFKQYVVMRKAAQDYAKSFNVSVLRRETDMVKSALKAQEQSQSYHAKLEGIKSNDREATVKALTDRANNIDDNYTRLAGQMSKFDSQLFLPARSAFDNAEGNSAAAWETLFNTLNSKGGRAVGSDPESVGLATQMLKMTMNVSDLNAVTPEEVQAAVAEDGSPEQAARAAQFVREAQQKNTEVITTLKSLDGSRKELREIEARAKMGTATQEQVARAQRVSAEAEEVLKNSFGGTPEELSERLEDLRARDTEYQGLLNDAQKAFDLAVQPGQEGLRTRMGRLLANEDFAAWAQDNGFKNLGRSKIDENGEVVYVQGLDDAQAIARYAYQLQHPDRHGPLFGRRGSTNQLVRITATDPEQRAQILEQNKLEDGRYAVDEKDALLSPLQYAQEMEKRGFAPTIQYASPKQGEFYLKNAEGTVYRFNADAGTYEQVEAPEGLKFKPAIVYDAKGAPLGYMTQDDIDKDNVEVGYDADGSETKAIEAKSPFKLVSADQLQGVGEIRVVGYLDPLHAAQASQYGTGAISINGGKQVFTRGVKIEKIGEEKPDLGVTVARAAPGREARQDAVQSAAERREASLDYEPMTPEELAKVEAPPPPPPPPRAEVPPNAWELAAAEAGDPMVRAQSLENQGLGSPAVVAGAIAEAAPPTAAAPATAPGKGVAWDDAGYKFEIDPTAQTITVVAPPSGKQMPGKTKFTFDEAARLGMGPKLKSTPPAGAASAPPAPTTPTSAPAPTGPVRVKTAPAPKPKSSEVGAFAGSPTVTYTTAEKPKEGLFAKIATALQDRRKDRPISSAAKTQRERDQQRRMQAVEAGQSADEALPEAEGPAPAKGATSASTVANTKKPTKLQKMQQDAFQKKEEVKVA